MIAILNIYFEYGCKVNKKNKNIHVNRSIFHMDIQF